jgi:hypothetical protein
MSDLKLFRLGAGSVVERAIPFIERSYEAS